MRTLKRKSGAVMQTKRSFLSLPNPRMPKWQNPGLQGRKGAFRLHENAESKKRRCGTSETLLFVPSGPTVFLETSRKSGPGAGGWGSGMPQPPASLSRFTMYFTAKQSIDNVSTYPLATPARGGGGLPLPAAASAAP